MMKPFLRVSGTSRRTNVPKSLPRSQVLAEAVRKNLFRDTPTETRDDKEEEGDLPSKPATKPKEGARGHTLYMPSTKHWRRSQGRIWLRSVWLWDFLIRETMLSL